MKGLLKAAIAAALITATGASRAGGQNTRAEQSDVDQFVGAWRLVALEMPRADGTPHAADAVGQFVFTPDGHAAVQVMQRAASAGPASGQVQYAQGGYEATFGRYTVDARAHTFTYRLEGSLVRSLVGQALVRSYEFSRMGSGPSAPLRLVVRPVSPDEHWRVVWERDVERWRGAGPPSRSARRRAPPPRSSDSALMSMER